MVARERNETPSGRCATASFSQQHAGGDGWNREQKEKERQSRCLSREGTPLWRTRTTSAGTGRAPRRADRSASLHLGSISRRAAQQFSVRRKMTTMIIMVPITHRFS